MGVPYDAEPVAEGLEGHDSVIAHPKLLPAAVEVDVLGHEIQPVGPPFPRPSPPPGPPLP